MPANGQRVLSERTTLGVTTAGPAFLAQASSPANKVLRSGVSILPMHKGVRERVTAKRRPSIKVHMRVTKILGVNLPL